MFGLTFGYLVASRQAPGLKAKRSLVMNLPWPGAGDPPPSPDSLTSTQRARAPDRAGGTGTRRVGASTPEEKRGVHLGS